MAQIPRNIYVDRKLREGKFITTVSFDLDQRHIIRIERDLHLAFGLFSTGIHHTMRLVIDDYCHFSKNIHFNIGNGSCSFETNDFLGHFRYGAFFISTLYVLQVEDTLVLDKTFGL